MTTTAATTLLRIFRDDRPEGAILETIDGDIIAAELDEIGVRFERWDADVDLPAGADQATVIDAYRSSIDRLMEECGYTSVDVIRLERGAANVEAMRAKFLDEHQHGEDEVRFFVEGRGAFYLHVGNRVYQVICVRGDLIGVPEGTKHWFDMGADSEFTAVRLFINPEGWVAKFTGDAIAQRFPKLESV
jgi:1,2-dihydroxy-3-keto-5-methylthiopentene dioxygenase